jgi:phosphate transport system substrate-binding protein
MNMPLVRHSFVSFCLANLFAILGSIVTVAHAAPALEIRTGGTGAASGPIRLLALEYAKLEPNVTVTISPSLGTSGGLQALRAGALDLALAGRALKAEEVAQGLQGVELGRTPAVFGVQSGDKLSEISSAQLAGWLTADVPVAADGSRLRLVLRPDSDGDTNLVRSLGKGVSDAMTLAQNRKGMIVAATDSDTAELIERTPGALGLSTLGLIQTEGRKIKVLKLNGVEPTTANAASGAYPLSKAIHVVSKEPRSPHVKAFVEFLGSPAARTLLAKHGFYFAASR